MKKNFLVALVAVAASAALRPDAAVACTGITLTSRDSACVLARTIEWGGSELESRYVVVPRGYRQASLLPGGAAGGMDFEAKYGYVGLAVELKEFVVEGLNEAGLSAGLFYFPGYGGYAAYDSTLRKSTVSDFQLVSYLLGSCATLEEVKSALQGIRVVGIDPRSSTVHWRMADSSGRQMVLEIVGGELRFFDNPLGVLTNSPGFEWQITNLNNYVNLRPGSAEAHSLDGTQRLAPFGAGSGMLGLPGDVTPPSRFVRATFYQATAPQQATGEETALQCFQILNNFDIPVGVEFPAGQIPADIPSATQWTSATDLKNRVVYYRTMYNSTIRSIDLKQIDFGRVAYRALPLDEVKHQPIERLEVD